MEAIKPNEKLRNARRERGWTQTQLAEKMAVGVSTVRSWESGTRFPSLAYRSRLCDVLQMTSEDLGFASQKDQTLDPMGSEGAGPDEKNEPQEETVYEFPPVTQAFRRATDRYDRENRHRMLTRVQSRWISGFLNHMINGPFIALNLQLRPDAVASPWRTTRNQEPYLSTLPVSTPMSIVEVYNEADRELLILGEPGAGKTTLLLELTRELVERCRKDEAFPIPVIFHLSSWAEKSAPLADWLVEELNLKYQVPLKMAQKWVTNDQIFPLLDGLDEVKPAARPACVKAINLYRQDHGFIPIVVCCRTSDYTSLPERLMLDMAIEVQSLTLQQIEDYISKSGKDLTAVRSALQNDPGLQEIVSTPLMLTILAYSFQGLSPEDVRTLQSSRHIVLEHYIERLLRKETKQHPRYTSQQIKQWLSWLAWHMVQHNQTEFYIERMQPDWIDSSKRHQYQRTVIRIVMTVYCIVSGALVAWLKGGLKNGIVGSGNGILGLFGGGAGNTMLGWMSPGVGGGSQGGASLIIILGVVIWLVTILVGSPSLPRITPRAIRHGLLSGLLASLKLGVPVGILGIPFFTLLGGLQHGITFGLGIGFFLGVLVGLMRALEGGLRYEQQALPQETTEKASIGDRVIDGLVLGAGSALSFMVVEVLLQVSYKSTLIYSGIVFLFFFFAYGFGGGTSLFSSLALTIKPAEMVTWSWIHMIQDMRENSKRSLIVALITAISVSAVIACTSSLFFFDVTYGVHYGLVFGTISGLIVGMAALLTSTLKSGWSSTILPEDQHTKPNEGIARSGRNALLGASIFAPLGGIASGLACAVGFGLVGQLPKWPVMGLAFALMLTIMFFVIFAIAHGGIAWIEHYTLRWYLWRAGSVPMNYVRFLNATSEYALMRRIGGGYMATHRLLLEHFAHLYQSTHRDLS